MARIVSVLACVFVFEYVLEKKRAHKTLFMAEIQQLVVKIRWLSAKYPAVMKVQEEANQRPCMRARERTRTPIKPNGLGRGTATCTENKNQFIRKRERERSVQGRKVNRRHSTLGYYFQEELHTDLMQFIIIFTFHVNPLDGISATVCLSNANNNAACTPTPRKLNLFEQIIRTD